MPIFLVKCHIDSYAEAEIEAKDEADAILKAKYDGDVNWDLDTQWDSSNDFTAEIQED